MAALLDTYAQFPFEVVRAEGCKLFDDSGKEYIDYYGGHAVCILGHCNPDFANRLKEQASKMLFYSNVAPMSLREKVASKLIEFAASDYSGVFFCNSGAEANENALKLAIQKTGRKRLVAFKGGWHGRTLLAVNVTDDPKWHKSLPGWIGEVSHLEPNLADELEKITDDCAAVILEPIQSIAGVRSFNGKFLAALRKRCDEVGAWLIFDEVQTGVGRLGVPYVSGHGLDENQVCADISTSAKSLGNGVPVGAMLVNERVRDTIKRGDLGSTFGGGPLAMTAVEFVLDTFKEKGLLQRASEVGSSIQEKLSSIEAVVEVRGRGGLLGIELDREAKPVHGALLERGLIVGTSGHPTTLRIMPPITLTNGMIDTLEQNLREVLA